MVVETCIGAATVASRVLAFGLGEVGLAGRWVESQRRTTEGSVESGRWSGAVGPRPEGSGTQVEGTVRAQ